MAKANTADKEVISKYDWSVTWNKDQENASW